MLAKNYSFAVRGLYATYLIKGEDRSGNYVISGGESMSVTISHNQNSTLRTVATVVDSDDGSTIEG